MSHPSTAAPKAETVPAAEAFHYTPQPGAPPYDKALIDQLARMRIKRGVSDHPRTKYLLPDGRARYFNRLFFESSPYLLQHAHNPVNWYPWGDEAFDTAKKLNRPIFLSVGYSTCHWCHVMEEESFEDEEIAKYLNEHYICIKVDREERPDIDAVYMAAVQALTGRGGWPMSVWLTPDRKPFYGGTYFPARDGDRGANIGFLSILEKLNKSFHESDGRAQNAAAQVTAAIRQMMASKPASRLPDKDILKTAEKFYRQSYDPKFGGLVGAPKFPSSLPVRFLLREYRRTGDQHILDMVTHSLSKMAGGGMYDHVGGGFHRYSTDERWLVPHFEKMLYDNALLAVAYLEAWQVTGNIDFKRVVDEILNYVSRDMTSSDGAFYSATDADSLTPEGRMEEGWYFTWTPKELESTLEKTNAAIIEKYYAVGSAPNFEGRHILHTPKSIEETAAGLDISKNKLTDIINASRKKLYAERNRRPAPFRDEKILTAWNGLMISAYARAGLAFDNPAYTKQAETAARFILDHLYINHKLYRSFKDGTARHNAYLEDYAFLIAALLDLYESDHRIQWLQTALELDDILKADYEDTENGGFFATGAGQEALIAREKPYYDSAVPSGNAVAALNLLRLYSFTTDYKYRQRAENLFKAFSNQLHATPSALSEMLTAIVFYLATPEEIIIITPDSNPGAAKGPAKDLPKNLPKDLIDAFRSRFIPNRILIVADESQVAAQSKIIPLMGEKKALNNNATAYVCKGGTCLRPTGDPEIFAGQIR